MSLQFVQQAALGYKACGECATLQRVSRGQCVSMTVFDRACCLLPASMMEPTAKAKAPKVVQAQQRSEGAVRKAKHVFLSSAESAQCKRTNLHSPVKGIDGGASNDRSSISM